MDKVTERLINLAGGRVVNPKPPEDLSKNKQFQEDMDVLVGALRQGAETLEKIEAAATKHVVIHVWGGCVIDGCKIFDTWEEADSYRDELFAEINDGGHYDSIEDYNEHSEHILTIAEAD